MKKKKNPKTRSEIMSAIKSQDTKPEKFIRLLLYHSGYRYRKNYKLLPGSPDLVLKKYKTAIFINGCFWHGHGCHISHIPKSNTEFWFAKIKRNLIRDKNKVSDLLSTGWRVLIIWECAINGKIKLSPEDIKTEIISFLNSGLEANSIQGI